MVSLMYHIIFLSLYTLLNAPNSLSFLTSLLFFFLCFVLLPSAKFSTEFFFLLPSATPRDGSCLRYLLKNWVMEEEGMVVGGSDLSTKIVCAGKEQFSKSLSMQKRNQMECCISFARKRARLEAAIIFGGVIRSVWILKAVITWLGTVGVKTKLEEKTKLILKYLQIVVKVEVN